MSETLWKTVDRQVNHQLSPLDAALDEALRSSAEAGLPPIQVSPAQGKLLHVLARSLGARQILEIGTLGAYSTIWLARALPPTGRLITLETNPDHAKVAQKNLRRAGLDGVVELRLGPALETLPQLEAEHVGPFDFTFIDADKPSTADYFDWAIRLSHTGSLIVVDNVVRGGALADAKSQDPRVHGMRRFLEHLAGDPRVTGSVVQTVGEKGYDGFALALVTGTEMPRRPAFARGRSPNRRGRAGAGVLP